MEKEVEDLLVAQINKELQSAYIYLDFYNYFEGRSLDGFAGWYKTQSEEEVTHAWGFINFLQDMGKTVTLTNIEFTSKTYNDPLEILKGGLEHEQYISGEIRKIYDKAVETKDYETQSFLKGFIDEQVEEEKNANAMLDRYDLTKNDLFQLDQSLLNDKDHD